MKLWITYTVKPGGGHQLDREPDMYRNVGIYETELIALRYGNEHGAKVIPIETGQTLEQAIENSRMVMR